MKSVVESLLQSEIFSGLILPLLSACRLHQPHAWASISEAVREIAGDECVNQRGLVTNGAFFAQGQCRRVRLNDDKSLGIIIAGPEILFDEMTTGAAPMRYIYKARKYFLAIVDKCLVIECQMAIGIEPSPTFYLLTEKWRLA